MMLFSRIRREDRGAAIAIVMLVGVVLILLSSVMVARGYRQLVNTSNDTHWDNALFSAEAGLDQALLALDYDFDYTTGQTIPDATLGTDVERVWAVNAADEASESSLVRVPEGEYVVVRPANSSVVFSVGYSPARSATDRRVRVIRASVEANPWEFQIEHALLVGKNLELSGNTSIDDLNDNFGAAVHANGTITTSGSYSVEGCITSSQSTLASTSLCPPSPAPREALPVIDPLALYDFAHFVLCPDQVAYGGPAHATSPDPDLIPCNGNETAVTLTGWTTQKQGGVVTWKTQPAANTSAVFYIHNGNFDGKLTGSTGPLEASIITANGKGNTCQTPATGHIQLAGNSQVRVHPSLSAAGYDLLFVAQGDVQFRGGAEVGGAILAHEQIDYRGEAGSWGGVIAVDACDTPGSPISTNKIDSLSTTSGSSQIHFPGPINTPFTANTLQVAVIGWYEL